MFNNYRFAFKLYLELYSIIALILRFEIQIDYTNTIDLLENITTLLCSSFAAILLRYNRNSIDKRRCKDYSQRRHRVV